MKAKWIVLTALAILVVAAGCSSSSKEKKSEAYHKVDAAEAKKMMEEQAVIIVDVRSQEEYETEHILNAVLVPKEEINKEAESKLPKKDAIYLVYCRTGVRSKQASDQLAELGYQHIYDFGGIVDWPYETVSNE